MGVQATQNTAVTGSTPTATYRSAAVLTIAGAVKISQQSLDRFGISADQIIAEQAAREAATTLDSEVLTKIITALPTSHKIANSGTAGVPALWVTDCKQVVRWVGYFRLPSGRAVRVWSCDEHRGGLERLEAA